MNKYSDLIGTGVWCKWIDITQYDVNDLDTFLEHEKDFSAHSFIFNTFGKLVAEDNKVILIAQTLAEKNVYIKGRTADIRSIPKNCILDLRELEFKKKEENNEEKLEP